MLIILFRTLELVKTYLMSTMGDERLSLLAILYTENDIPKNFNWLTLANEFAEIKARNFPARCMTIV